MINNKVGGFNNPIVGSLEFGANAWTSNAVYPRILADMNNDGFKDIVGFAAGGVFVALNKKLTGLTASFKASTIWYPGLFGTSSGWSDQNVFPRTIADVNGDGWNDIVGFSAGGVVVSLNKGIGAALNPGMKLASVWCSTNFGTLTGWSDNINFGRKLIDMNNDGKADVVGFHASGVMVALANTTGTAFLPPFVWLSDFGKSSGYMDMNIHPRSVVDLNNDGYPDIISFLNGTRVALNTKNLGLNNSTLWLNEFSSNKPNVQSWPTQLAAPRMIGNINNDAFPDIIAFNNNVIMVSLNDAGLTFKCPTTSTVGTQFTGLAGWADQSTYPRFLANIDGDTRKEIIGFGPLGITVMNCTSGVNFRQGDVSETESSFTSTMAIEKLSCYPNPFNSNLTIDYKTSDASEVSVVIFNSLGSKIKELKGISGESSLSFSGENLENGTYFCLLYENGKISAKKSIVLQK